MKMVICSCWLLAGLFSCNFLGQKCQPEINETEVKVISMPEKYFYEISLDKMFSQVDCIPLETSKDCHLVNPSKVIYFNNQLYILDFRRGLYVFDETGIYMHSIGRIGRGPGELIEMNDFDFDEVGNILILDFKRIMRFDPDGNFIDKYLDVDFMENEFYCNPYQFVFIRPHTFYIWGGTMGIEDNRNNDHFAMYILERNKLVKKFFPLQYKLSDKQHRFLRSDSGILINPVLGNDTIYSISGEEISSKYFIKFDKSITTNTIPKQLKSLSDFGYNLLQNDNISYDILNPLESTNWLTFTFTHRKTRVISLFDKRENQIYTIKGFSPNSKTSEIIMPYFFHFAQENSFCSIIPAGEFLTIKEGVARVSPNVMSINFRNSNVKKDDNHIVVKYIPK